jgi:hypothetical protein
MSKGYTENEALAKAYKAIEYKVMVQSSVLSYIDIFYISYYFILHSFHPFDQKEKKSILLMQCINKHKRRYQNDNVLCIYLKNVNE